MQSDLPVIDMDFGTTQLSGNRNLFIKLLKKFQVEYADASNRIKGCIDGNELNELKLIIHTIKGVSGNLGLKALHQACRSFEEDVIGEQITDSGTLDFLFALNQCFEHIELVSMAPEPETLEVKHSIDSNAQASLISTIGRNEYIPPHELLKILSSIEGSKQSLDNIYDAINDLDYPKAINLLKEL
jgi:HPt (histidine-containing phosphotransfer) domain-containing protein